MKVLLANKYLYPRGGDCIYTLRLMELLKSKGHTVIPFSMRHEQNIYSQYGNYFVPNIDFRQELKNFGIKSCINVMSRAVINTTAVRLIDNLIRDTGPDIVHLNNIHHQLTPAIIKVPFKYGIPVVWTLHDYILNCPENSFLRNGKSCDKCAEGNNIHAVINRCKKGSLAASLIAAIECSIYSLRKLAKMVNMFITPSRFMADILIKHGLSKDQVVNIPNFVPPINIDQTGNDYFLYFGRLSPEKGIYCLLHAFAKLGYGRLIIAGDGPDRENLESTVRQLKLTEVEFVGHQSPEAIFKLLSGCLAAIVPSICRDNFPFSVMEAMALGKPVIASSTGGIPEQVEHGKTGLIFAPGDVDQLYEHMQLLYGDNALASRLGEAGRNKALTMYTAETHLDKILKIYNDLADNKKHLTIEETDKDLVTATKSIG